MMSALNLERDSKLTTDLHRDAGAAEHSKRTQVKDVQSPTKNVRLSNGPAVGMWTPDKGIKFANTGGLSERKAATQPQDTRWHPSKGMKFS